MLGYIKQMANAIACTIELWMHLGGSLGTQEARVVLGYRPKICSEMQVNGCMFLMKSITKCPPF